MNHEFFEYEKDKPYIFIPVYSSTGRKVNERLFSHWHEELEIAYCKQGNARHYINGESIDEKPGHVIVTNSEFMHSIIPETQEDSDVKIVTYVLIIRPSFLKICFPSYDEIYFSNEETLASEKIASIFEDLFELENAEISKLSFLHAESLILDLLYHLSCKGIVKRNEVDNINVQKDIERMKGVISFIKEHFREKIPQALVAKKFYFSISYFSRYFKKMMGVSYSEFLMNYRLYKAERELVTTCKSIMDIAVDNGFADDRRFIISFKKKFSCTPLQYRKYNWSINGNF